MSYHAVLINSISIQQYIFSSNKLKEQIGASYIVEKLIFNELIPLALKSVFLLENEPNANEWEKNTTYKKLQEDDSAEFEIGYIGGGNALVLFRQAEKVKAFIQDHSLKLLQYFPGVKTVYATDSQFEYEGKAYKDCRDRLSQSIIQNRSFHYCLTLPFKLGIVDDCSFSGESLEHFKIKENFYSSVSFSKLNENTSENAQTYLTERLLNENEREKYAFTNNQEKLGQPDEKGYIAIVHADGNGMGQLFLEADSLASTRDLSVGTKQYADNVLKALIQDVIKTKPSVENLKSALDDKNRPYLPIRPIISGGDDITFVCEGRLGMYLAERLLVHMTQEKIAGKQIQACAGVVMVHSKFPFYKAYKLCEEVTREAKKYSRNNEKSWLHYHLSTGGLSGELNEIIEREFVVPGKGNLKFGPYVINDPDSDKDFYKLKKLIKEFADNWPRGKAKELRDVLRRPEADEKYFIASLNVHDNDNKDKLKATIQRTDSTLWKEKHTPYFDSIELLDFYPYELLKIND